MRSRWSQFTRCTGRRFHFRGMRRGRGLLPSAPRRLGREALHRRPRRRERLRVETRGYVVALLIRILVAPLRREREPFVGLGEIRFDADAARVKNPEGVLAVGDATVGGLAEPLRGVAVIGVAVDAFGLKHGEVMHRLAVPLAGGSGVEAARGLEVFPHPLALLVQAAQPVLRGGEAVIGGALEPLHRLLETRWNAAR